MEEEEILDKSEDLLEKIDEIAYPEMIMKAAKLLAEAGTNDGTHYTIESIIMDLFVATQFDDFDENKIEEYKRP